MDAIEKVTGTARYTADIQAPRLHAAILRAAGARPRH
jgi:CO/xanthine dehydrogenase Mo-binding subunit